MHIPKENFNCLNFNVKISGSTIQAQLAQADKNDAKY